MIQIIYILAILLLGFLPTTGAVSMGSYNDYNVDFVLKSYESNETNSQLDITVSYPSSIYNGDAGLYVTCVNTGNENYTLDTVANGLSAFSYTDKCATSTCDSSSDTSGIYSTGTVNYLASADTFIWQTGGTDLSTPVDRTTDGNTKSKITFKDMTPAIVSSHKLPSSGSKYYYRCFSVFDATISSFTGSTITVSAGANRKNVTLSNNAIFGRNIHLFVFISLVSITLNNLF